MKKVSNAAQLIKQTRLKMGISQGKLCRKLGYSTPQYLSNFERGLCYFPNKKLKKAATMLNIPYWDMADAVFVDVLTEFHDEWDGK